MDDVALNGAGACSLIESESACGASSTDACSSDRFQDEVAADCTTVESPAGESVAVDAAAPPADPQRLATMIEALLFSSDTPLSLSRIGQLVECTNTTQLRLCIASLNDKYAAAGMSFRVEAIARGYQLMTLPEFQPLLDRLHAQRSETRLTDATLEALAIVAYKQPIIRADIEALRGVGCGEVLNRLREMGLVRVVGRADVVGRPMLYGTTKKFLDVFGLADLEDLPPMEALKFRAAGIKPESRRDEPPLAVAGA